MNDKSIITERSAEGPNLNAEVVVLNLNKAQEQIKSESNWLNLGS